MILIGLKIIASGSNVTVETVKALENVVAENNTLLESIKKSGSHPIIRSASSTESLQGIPLFESAFNINIEVQKLGEALEVIKRDGLDDLIELSKLEETLQKKIN